MCGIFGYISNNKAKMMVYQGLKRLEYRGHDSWGITTWEENKLHTHKQVGEINQSDSFSSLQDGPVAIGHTRWATHGGVTKTNAHPHLSPDGTFALAHNGIVENYQALKHKLQMKGVTFKTTTDTEVIVHLVAQLSKSHSLKTAIRKTFKLLTGRNTIILLTETGKIYAVKNGSPMVIGIAKNKLFFSSDTLSFSPFTNSIKVLEDNQMAVATVKGELSTISVITGKSLNIPTETIDFKHTTIDKAGYEHYMLKEIHDTPYCLRQVSNTSKTKLEKLAHAITTASQVYCVGSGTSGVAAGQIAFYLNQIGKTPTKSLIGAEAISYLPLVDKNTLIIAPSQSGETADVIEFLEKAKKRNATLATYVNMPGSQMNRMAELPFAINAGPEICVMSTKVLSAMFAWGYLLSKTVVGKYDAAVSNLNAIEAQLETLLESDEYLKKVKGIASVLTESDHIFLLGKGDNIGVIQEGMIKIIEGSYKHAHGIPAGDLKHYAITIVEPGVPVIFFISDDNQQSDVYNAVNEVKTRGGTVIGISYEPSNLFDHIVQVPKVNEVSSIINVVTVQLLAYYLAQMLGTNIDKPRHIAKSVTVK